MQKFINCAVFVALGIVAFVNIKQQNEIVQAFGETYRVQHDTGWGFYFINNRLGMLEYIADKLCEDRPRYLPAPNPKGNYMPYPGGHGDVSGMYAPYPPGVNLE